MAEIKELIRLVENLYAAERVIDAMEKQPRYYNTEHLLYTNEVHTLKMIAQNEGMTQKELTEKMFRTKGATSIMISKLEKKDLIQRITDQDDTRQLRLYLTEEGKKVNESHIQYDENKINGWQEKLAFTDAEVIAANHVIETMIEVLGHDVL